MAGGAACRFHSGSNASAGCPVFAQPRPALFTDKEEDLKSIGAPAMCTMNGLSPESYRGANDRYGRRDQIPGSINVPAGTLLEPASGSFRSADELVGIFSDLAASKDRAGGVTAMLVA